MVTMNGNVTHFMNGHAEKNGGITTYDPEGTKESTSLNGGFHIGKEELMNDFQMKIGQDMDIGIPSYDAQKHDTTIDENGAKESEDMYNEEVYYYPVDEVIVENCCPAGWYRKFPCCLNESSVFMKVQ